MKNNRKKVSDSLAVQTKMVLPNDTNPLNTLFGGRLLEWMDEIASISAHKHCGRVVVTASINNVSFDQPIFCLLYTSPSPRDAESSRMPSSA